MINLVKADFADCSEMQKMQSTAFNELLLKYRDYKTNPALETLDVIREKMKSSDYYFIMCCDDKIGGVRIIRSESFCRISPIFILPEFQNKGYAQTVLKQIELLYPEIKEWHLDTIKQEEKLIHLYNKLGYKETGREECIQSGMDIVFLEKHIS